MRKEDRYIGMNKKEILLLQVNSEKSSKEIETFN